MRRVCRYLPCVKVIIPSLAVCLTAFSLSFAAVRLSLVNCQNVSTLRPVPNMNTPILHQIDFLIVSVTNSSTSTKIVGPITTINGMASSFIYALPTLNEKGMPLPTLCQGYNPVFGGLLDCLLPLICCRAFVTSQLPKCEHTKTCAKYEYSYSPPNRFSYCFGHKFEHQYKNRWPNYYNKWYGKFLHLRPPHTK